MAANMVADCGAQTDSGVTWSQVYQGEDGVYDVAIDAYNSLPRFTSPETTGRLRAAIRAVMDSHT